MTSARLAVLALALLAPTASSAAFLHRLKIGRPAAKQTPPAPALATPDECVPDLPPLNPLLTSANEKLVDVIKGVIDNVYDGRDIQRFYILETIARVPYFSYLSCLHLYESCGMRTSVELMRTHYAEADNELHHLLIMEALGGSDAFADRFVAQHLAFGYYWYCVLIFFLHPRAAYHLNELIEEHAYGTYDAFLREHEAELRQQPVPEVARRYYEGGDPMNRYMLHGDADAKSSAKTEEAAAARNEKHTWRKPRKLRSLYDVFLEVRDDEASHWDTLQKLVTFHTLDAPEGCEVSLSPAA